MQRGISRGTRDFFVSTKKSGARMAKMGPSVFPGWENMKADSHIIPPSPKS